MDLVDAGLSGLYAADCAALARLATAVGRHDWASELTSRADAIVAAFQSVLWVPSESLWLNRYFNATSPPESRFLALDSTKSPPNFYPLWSGAPTIAQVGLVFVIPVSSTKVALTCDDYMLRLLVS